MGKTDVFLDKYRQLEETVRGKFGSSISISRLEELGEFRRYSSKIKYCRELRNLLVHNPKLDGEWAAEVNDAMISFVQRLILLIERPPRVCDYALGLKRIMYRNLGSNVVDTMHEMRARDVSKVPILDRGRVVGVFTHESVFSRVLANTHDIREDMTFRDILPEISIVGERAKRYRFAKWSALASSIEEIFEESNAHHVRIRLVFLTENGRSDEKLMGIVTPWELMDAD